MFYYESNTFNNLIYDIINLNFQLAQYRSRTGSIFGLSLREAAAF